MGLTTGLIPAVTTYAERYTQLVDFFTNVCSDLMDYVTTTGSGSSQAYYYKFKPWLGGGRQFYWLVGAGSSDSYIVIQTLNKLSSFLGGCPGFCQIYPLTYKIVRNANSGALVIKSADGRMWGFMWSKGGDVTLFTGAQAADTSLNMYHYSNTSETSLTQPNTILDMVARRTTDGKNILLPLYHMEDSNQYINDTPCIDLFRMASITGILPMDIFTIDGTQYMYAGYKTAIRINP